MHPTQLRPGPISLREALPKARWLRDGDVRVTTCVSDWRACRPGDLFFALTTADDDGHEHAAAAIAKGAVAVVAERLVVVDAPLILVRDSRAALSRVCQALAGHPSSTLRTIGVTGTAGKTTVTMLLASMIEEAGETAGVMSSLGHSDSLAQRAASSATPTAPEFADWLRRMNTAGCDNALLELSSRALAERRVSGISLDAAVLTNIQDDHLDLHNTFEAYRRIKRRIFKLLKPGGLAVVNADDHRCRAMLPKIKAACLTYAIHSDADIQAQVLERSLSEQTFLITAGDETATVRTRIIGDAHVSNCLAATAVGLAMGFGLQTIVRGLEKVDRLPGRLERIECGQPFGVFVDAAATPETLSQSIKTLRQATRGRVFVVAGSREGTAVNRRALLGRVIERGCHVPVLTSDDPGHEQPLQIIHDLLDGFQRPGKAQVIPDRATAIRWALSQVREGDSVLVAGKGDRTGQLIGRKRMAHDDREIACAWLYDQGASEIKRQSVRPRFRVVG